MCEDDALPANCTIPERWLADNGTWSIIPNAAIPHHTARPPGAHLEVCSNECGRCVVSPPEKIK